MKRYRNPNNTPTHKQCPHCGEVKLREDFPKNRNKSDGLYGWCRPCTYWRNGVYAIENPRPARTKEEKRKPGPKPKIREIVEIRCVGCERVKEEGDKFRSGLCKTCILARRAEGLRLRDARIRVQRLELKRKVVASMGGKCTHCGYDRYFAGLTFHHVGEKENTIGALLDIAAVGSDKSMVRLMAEVEKCVLLCFNCHMGLHAGEWQL